LIGLLAGHDMAAPRAVWVDVFSLRSSPVNHGRHRRCCSEKQRLRRVEKFLALPPQTANHQVNLGAAEGMA